MGKNKIYYHFVGLMLALGSGDMCATGRLFQQFCVAGGCAGLLTLQRYWHMRDAERRCNQARQDELKWVIKMAEKIDFDRKPGRK